jgi:hypothetical protein
MCIVQEVGSLLARCRGFHALLPVLGRLDPSRSPAVDTLAHRLSSPLRNHHPQYRRNRHVLRCMHFV